MGLARYFPYDEVFEIIETYWNVNGVDEICKEDTKIEIIETYWNVNKKLWEDTGILWQK